MQPVYVLFRVEAQMILSRPVVAAEGAGRLDLLTPERAAVDGEPAPSGGVHDGYSYKFLCQTVHLLRGSLGIMRRSAAPVWAFRPV